MEGILRNKKGITLIELIVVIVLLGIIAAITIPTVGNLISAQQAKADEATYDLVLYSARLYAVVEEPSTSATFSLADVIAAGFLDENPFDQVAGAIEFEYAGGVWVYETEDLTIEGREVGPQS